MVTGYEKGRRQLVEEVRILRSKLARLEPVEFKANPVEQMSAEQEIKSLARFPSENPYPVLRVSRDGKVLYANKASIELLKDRGSKIGGPAPSEWHKATQKALNSRSVITIDVKHKGRIFALSMIPVPDADYCNFYGVDVTENKKAEEERDVTIQLLSLMNTTNHKHEMMRLVAMLLRDWFGGEAVGIRLAEGEDFPYFVTSGFGEEFILAENRLCSVNETGELVRDCQGKVFLECMCGNVISGRFDSSKPFFTKHGSFWTNSTTELLAGTTENDRLAKTRNRCNTAGYESVALIPLRVGDKTFGLLQFNDRRKGRFGLEKIFLFERLADNLAIGLAQRQAEQALRESEEKFRSFVQNFQGIAFRGKMDFTPVLFHGSVEEITGYTEKEFVAGKLKWNQVIHPDDLTAVFTDDGKKLRSVPNYSYEREYRIVRKDGQIRWVHEVIQNICDESNKPAMVQGAIYDITERKKVEDLVVSTKARLEHLLSSSSAVIYSSETSGNYAATFISKSVKEIMGYEPEKFIKDADFWFERIHPEDKPRVSKEVPVIFNKGRHAYEYRFKHRDGTYRWMRDEMKLVCDSAGNPMEIVGYWIDITERKKAEEALQKSEIRFRELFESMSSGVAVYEAIDDGEDFVFKDMNKAGERIDEINRADIIGKKVTEAFPGVKKLGLFEVFQRVWRTGKPEYHPCSFYEDERISQWVENRVYKLPSGEIVAVYDDVTGRKQAEEKLTDYYSKLKAMAISSLLTEERERQLIAQGLHDDIGQKLAMAKIDLLSSLRDEAHQPAPELTEKICSNIDAMIERVRSLTFELSNPVLTELGLEAAIERHLGREVRDKYGIEFELVRCELLTHLDENLNRCLFRAVRELLNNIIKHAQAKKVTVSLSRENNEIIIIVADDGIGFDVSEVRRRIGDGGTFGLFSVREQLESLGGRLKIKSNSGQGSRFTIVVSSDATAPKS